VKKGVGIRHCRISRLALRVWGDVEVVGGAVEPVGKEREARWPSWWRRATAAALGIDERERVSAGRVGRSDGERPEGVVEVASLSPRVGGDSGHRGVAMSPERASATKATTTRGGEQRSWAGPRLVAR
jgi:hypothetical protein